ncbi:MAG TPA: lipoate--protein ligase [Clostridia bacterium]|nr:lipoate--protein ligase [Clostridia bacterium]HOR12718.1 lipoate--protein ligase [Clostridia bacterium]
MQNAVFLSKVNDPYYNLSLETLLFESGVEGCTLYLWQNQNTVVLGKNQNAWKECRASLLEQEGGLLARRASGGGAVFHDLGNLNFTFIVKRSEYDVMRQLSIIQQACRRFGIETEFSGRNDLLVSKNLAKFSGNAFRFSKDTALHHGTVLVSADLNKLGRYLAPSPEKLSAKGVESVRQRVVNLCELNPEINVENMKKALLDAFIKNYGPSRVGQIASLNQQRLEELRTLYASWQWRMGETPSFDIALERRFEWGGVELQLSLERGIIVNSKVYSDAMDEEFIERIPPVLLFSKFNSLEMAERLKSLRHAEANELAAWIEEKGF